MLLGLKGFSFGLCEVRGVKRAFFSHTILRFRSLARSNDIFRNETVYRKRPPFIELWLKPFNASENYCIIVFIVAYKQRGLHIRMLEFLNKAMMSKVCRKQKMGSKKLIVSSLCAVLLTIIFSRHFNIDRKIQLNCMYWRCLKEMPFPLRTKKTGHQKQHFVVLIVSRTFNWFWGNPTETDNWFIQQRNKLMCETLSVLLHKWKKKKRRNKETSFQPKPRRPVFITSLKVSWGELTHNSLYVSYLLYVMRGKIKFFIIEKWSWIDPFTFFSNFDWEQEPLGAL